ncbi:MAG TPA: hypothetical protein VMR90_03685 [Candidatus Cybelea sp.]|nr:hypothetical protein [Candidatus Cybelea sp.]
MASGSPTHGATFDGDRPRAGKAFSLRFDPVMTRLQIFEGKASFIAAGHEAIGVFIDVMGYDLRLRQRQQPGRASRISPNVDCPRAREKRSCD